MNYQVDIHEENMQLNNPNDNASDTVQIRESVVDGGPTNPPLDEQHNVTTHLTRTQSPTTHALPLASTVFVAYHP